MIKKIFSKRATRFQFHHGMNLIKVNKYVILMAALIFLFEMETNFFINDNNAQNTRKLYKE